MVATSTLLFGALLLLCAALAAVMGRKLLAQPKAAAGTGPAPTHSPWIAKAVEDEKGEALGEVVRIQGEDVVVKHGGLFLVLPRAALSERGEKLRAGDFDRAEAGAKGEAWRKQQEDVMKVDAHGMPVLER